MLVLFAYVFAVALPPLVLFIAADEKQRKKLLNKLGLQQRRLHGPFIPPQDLSAKAQGLPPNEKPSSSPGYEEVFPPSRRHILAELPDGSLKSPGKSGKELGQQPPNYSKLTPDKETPTADEYADHVTATGFTIDEIKRLGDFPDYAALSGVPAPEPYKDFDISKAVPRPYRPFRWAYHQTMCKLSNLVDRQAPLTAKQHSRSWSQTGGSNSTKTTQM